MGRQSDLQQIQKNQEQEPKSFKRSIRNSQLNEQLKFTTQRRKSLKDQRKNKSAQYRKSIAKQRRQQKINIARETNHISYIHSQMDKLSQEFNTRLKRQQFIQIILQTMHGKPNEQWRQAMNSLLWSIKCFYMSKQTNKLMKNEIVDKLCLTLEKRFMKENLWHKGAYLLEKIIFLNPKILDYIVRLIKQRKRGRFVAIVFECSLQQEGSLAQISNCIELIATMMSINCKLVISKIGIDTAIMFGIKWLQRIMLQGKSIEKPLSKVYRYLIYLSRQISQSWISLQKQFRFLIKKLLETLNQAVQFHQSHQNHQKLIIIISTLTQYPIPYDSSSSHSQDTFSIILPICIILASMSNILDKIIDLTVNELKQTVRMVVKLLQFSIEPQDEDIELKEILKSHIKQQKQKRQKQKQIPENSKTTTRTLPIINNFISYLLIIYEQNHKAKQIIIKIQQFFRFKTKEILTPKSHKFQRPHLSDDQSSIQNSQTNQDVQI